MSKPMKAIHSTINSLAGLAGAGFNMLTRRSQAQIEGKITLSGLRAPVEVFRDRWGIPHIYAQDETDLMFAQGFVHAQDRLWQMEFNRRLVAGRLSEILGEVAVPLDRWLRILGFRRAAEPEPSLLPPSLFKLIHAYATGVNTFIEMRRYPLEFSLLRYEPQTWTVADSVSWGKMMAWSLSVNWETEILRTQLVARLGESKAAELEPGYFSKFPTILQANTGSTPLAMASAARQFTGPTAKEGLGSNNWVISGQRTTTGMPLLANDMHLQLSAPSIWYENHLVGGDLNVAGVTFLGVPGVIAGHNQHVAWGFTNGYPDVQDLYIEHLRRTEDGRVQYEYKDEWLDAEVIREFIQVKDSEPVIQEVIITRHGPIINELAPDLTGDVPLALRWTALEPEEMLLAVNQLNIARSCIEVKEALRHWDTPVQNVVYADTQGNIGYSLPGNVPIRAKGDGRMPVPGWTGEYEWIGYIPFDELPHMYNPPQGYIVTANNRVVGDDYPHYLGYDHVTGNRAQRIVELIEGQDKISPDYIKDIQFDQVSPHARVVAGYLSQLETEDPELKIVVDQMLRWNGELSPQSAEAVIYELFFRRVIRLILDHYLGDLGVRYSGKGPTPVLAEGSLFGERAYEWLEKILSEPNSNWWDIGSGIDRAALMQTALRQTIDELKRTQGPSIDHWQWGKLHKLRFTHILGSVKPLDKIFNRGPYPVGGDSNTVWNTATAYHDPSIDQLIGPPFRFIANLSDLGKCQGLLAPGQSGQPGSKHYDDQVEAWFTRDYHPMYFTREEVEKAAEGKLILEPG